ncbi:MAG: Rne/Rng family ribonuclease [Myxococcales bacterium]|nr:Rne/Rng family ribonuclease [Myxococcales bacterium]
MTTNLYIHRNQLETRVALQRDGRLTDLEVEHTGGRSLSGNIYRGRVKRIERNMNAAFVDLGLERMGLLHAADVWTAGLLPPRAAGAAGDVEGAPRGRPKTKPIGRLLETGQEIMVQVTREPAARKGPRVTMFVSLPGRNVVLLPQEPHVGVSRMIDDPAERQRLFELVHRLLPTHAGAIVRTVGEGSTEAEIGNDIAFLRAQWQDIIERYAHASAPSFLHVDLDLTLRALRDLVDPEMEMVWIDDDADRERVETFLTRFHPEARPQVRLHDGPQPLFQAFGLDGAVRAALTPTVALPGGGDIVIERTEAMTVIDVNSGSREEGDTLAGAQLRLNLFAAREIAAQLRLRNIGGLVAIDFVKMRRPEDRRMLEAVLEAELGVDQARVRITRMNQLGIIMLTRKRVRQSIYARLSEPCAICDGRGYVRSASDLAVEALERLRQALGSKTKGTYHLRAPARACAILQGQLAGVLRDMSSQAGVHVTIESDPRPDADIGVKVSAN